MQEQEAKEQEVVNEKRATVSSVILETLGENEAATFAFLQKSVAAARQVGEGQRVRIWKTLENLIEGGQVVRVTRGLFALKGSLKAEEAMGA